MMWKILVADDEAMERNILKEILEENLSNVSVRCAADGLSAVETATLWGANLALLDIEMPGMTGIRAAAKIRAALPKCQIIFLTAYGRFDYAQEALRLQVYDYLLKPAEDADILLAVRRALDKISPLDLTAAPSASFHTELREAGTAQTDTRLPAAPVQAFPTEDTTPASDKNRKLLLQVQNYLTEHYAQDISLEMVAELLDFSPFYLSKLFKNTFGTSFIDYLTELRLSAAKELLSDPSLSAKEIGEQVGYPNSNYFTKLFKKKTGLTPIEYRNSLR
ncbi:MAG: response regulator [Faecalibacterium sp.]